ncbi:MAG TPA: hypothetical protein VIY48_00720 [Candidatus Paceibacterota bacterium]
MSEIPEFAVAVSTCRQFLAEQGYAGELLWVFRDDLWVRGQNNVVMRLPLPAENASLAEKIYGEGRERGLVKIEAVTVAGGHVAATVWFPKFPEEALQGWSQGLKLSIRQPLPIAKVVGCFRWRMIKCLAGYQRYQRYECSIGSRHWAAS